MIDLSLSLVIALEFDQGVFEGVDIWPQWASEAVNCVNPGLLRVIEPDVEFLNVFNFEECLEIA